jgi:putative ATPase
VIAQVNDEKIARTRDLDRVAKERQRRWRDHHRARRAVDFRDVRRMSTRPKRGPSLFEAAGLDQDAPRPLADRLRPTSSPRSSGRITCSARRRAHPHAGDALARLAGVLGSARHRQDHGGAAAGRRDRAAFRAVVRGVLRRRRPQEGFEAARARREMGQGTLLFIDEVHRFNRAQQDSFLPVMEDGTVVLVGATTENPSFELNAALLSRARVLVFKSLDAAAIEKLLARAEEVEASKLPLDADARASLVRMADGDGRASLTLAEEVWRAARKGETSTLRSCRRWCSGARRSTTSRRTATTI